MATEFSSNQLLERLYLLLGIAVTGYTFYLLRKRTASHEHHNRTDHYCFTCDKGL